MASKISINLDTTKEYFNQEKCKQDDDLTLEASIYENGLALDLSNKEIMIKALKADNTYIIQSTEITKESNKILAELDRDFSRVPGTTKIEVLLIEGGKQNTTFSFYLEVVESVTKGAVESDNTVTILEELDKKVLEAGQVKVETEQLIKTGGAATTGQVKELNASLEQIAKSVILIDSEDGTTKIQNALDSGGIINVFVNNIAYISKTLEIGDNTSLNIKNGTLKLKSGTKNYMIKNKDQVNGNINIEINGIFDIDGSNNGATGSYPDRYPGHGLFFHNVNGFRSEYLKIMNCVKYCSLFVNVDNIYIKTYEVNSSSDGIHFQGNTRNINIDLVSGYSGDDLVAWTMTDYPNYRVEDKGEVKNVTIGEIRGLNYAKSALLLHGGGSDDKTIFTNFKIGSITGTFRETTLRIMNDDGDSISGIVNGNTRLDSFFVDNINAETQGIGAYLYTRGGDVCINKIKLKSGSATNIDIKGLDEISLNNVKNDKSGVMATNYKYIKASDVGRIVVNNYSAEYDGDSTGAFLFLAGQINEVILNDVNLNVKTKILQVYNENTIIEKITINNMLFKGGDIISNYYPNSFVKKIVLDNLESIGGVPLNIYIVSHVRITGNSEIQIYRNGTSKLSINSDKISISQNPDTILEPKKYDKVISLYRNNLIIYDGTAWKNTID